MILRTDGGLLHYDVRGHGSPIVFVSGWAMSGGCWRPATSILERKHRCLTLDSRGAGRSQPVYANAGFSLEDHADDLHSIMESARVFDSVLVGHEMGALVAAVCACRHPQSVRSLVLVSPRSFVLEDEIRSLSVLTPATLALRELAAFPIVRNMVAWRFRSAPRPYREELFEDFADLNPRAAYETALAAAEADSAGFLESMIRESRIPILLVCGEKDRRGSRRARELFSRMRVGRLATLRGCGFLPMLEYPRQFARLIDQFAETEERRALSSGKDE